MEDDIEKRFKTLRFNDVYDREISILEGVFDKEYVRVYLCYGNDELGYVAMKKDELKLFCEDALKELKRLEELK